MSCQLQEVVLMFVGIDWASTEHAVCVLDQAGKTVRAFRIPTRPLGSATSWPACAGSARRPGYQSRSNAPTGGWSTGCWRPATLAVGLDLRELLDSDRDRAVTQARLASGTRQAQPVLPVQEKPPAFNFCRFAGAYRWSASFAPSPR
jgi:hypothetical protein